MTRRVWWGDFKASDFAAIDPHATIALLPVAAIEQHGPHLPLSTDAAIMDGMLAETIARIPNDLDLRMLPVQSVGKSNEHAYAPGTLTLGAKILIDAWTELGASVARTGVRKIVLLTSHGGNEEVIGIVARELRVRFGMLAVKSSWNRFGFPNDLFSQEEQRLGIHGGDVETSLMLHFRPDLVDMSQAENFASSVVRAERDFELLRPTGPHGFAWTASDLHPQGVVGDAAAATALKGQRTAVHQIEGLLRLLGDIGRARIDDYFTSPGDGFAR